MDDPANKYVRDMMNHPQKGNWRTNPSRLHMVLILLKRIAELSRSVVTINVDRVYRLIAEGSSARPDGIEPMISILDHLRFIIDDEVHEPGIVTYTHEDHYRAWCADIKQAALIWESKMGLHKYK